MGEKGIISDAFMIEIDFLLYKLHFNAFFRKLLLFEMSDNNQTTIIMEEKHYVIKSVLWDTVKIPNIKNPVYFSF